MKRILPKEKMDSRKESTFGEEFKLKLLALLIQAINVKCKYNTALDVCLLTI